MCSINAIYANVFREKGLRATNTMIHSREAIHIAYLAARANPWAWEGANEDQFTMDLIRRVALAVADQILGAITLKGKPGREFDWEALPEFARNAATAELKSQAETGTENPTSTRAERQPQQPARIRQKYGDNIQGQSCMGQAKRFAPRDCSQPIQILGRLYDIGNHWQFEKVADPAQGEEENAGNRELIPPDQESPTISEGRKVSEVPKREGHQDQSRFFIDGKATWDMHKLSSKAKDSKAQEEFVLPSLVQGASMPRESPAPTPPASAPIQTLSNVWEKLASSKRPRHPSRSSERLFPANEASHKRHQRQYQAGQPQTQAQRFHPGPRNPSLDQDFVNHCVPEAQKQQGPSIERPAAVSVSSNLSPTAACFQTPRGQSSSPTSVSTGPSVNHSHVSVRSGTQNLTWGEQLEEHKAKETEKNKDFLMELFGQEYVSALQALQSIDCLQGLSRVAKLQSLREWTLEWNRQNGRGKPGSKWDHATWMKSLAKVEQCLAASG